MANYQRKYTGVLFLDLVRTFDNVIPWALIILLKKYGMPDKITRYIDAMTSDRCLIGYTAGLALQRRSTSRGLLQGSILSPILFNLYFTLIEICLPLPIHILMYADDIAIYCAHESLDCISH